MLAARITTSCHPAAGVVAAALMANLSHWRAASAGATIHLGDGAITRARCTRIHKGTRGRQGSAVRRTHHSNEVKAMHAG